MSGSLVQAQGLFKFHGQGGDPNAILCDVSFQVEAGGVRLNRGPQRLRLGPDPLCRGGLGPVGGYTPPDNAGM